MTALRAKVDLRLGDSSQPWDPEGSTTVLKSTLPPIAPPAVDWRGEIEALFPEFALITPVASGAISRVFEIVDRATQEPFALKAVPIGPEASSLRDRLEREWQVLGMLQHPNIVRGCCVRKSEAMFYLLMEYVSDLSVAQRVARYGPLPPRLAAKYLGEAANGLAAAHVAGVIHRDVKPSNLLLDRMGAIKVVDFGMALLERPDLTSITLAHGDTLLGTVDYMAPEQAQSSHDVDPRADIYALGCTLHFLLTGRPPFASGSLPVKILRHRTEPPPDLRVARPDAPPALVALFERMMAKDPADRFPCMEQVRDAAEQAFVDAKDLAPAVDRIDLKAPMGWPERSPRAEREAFEMEQLAACLNLTLRSTGTGQPVSQGMAAILTTLRDQIECVLERGAKE